jgi:hypothetical protein
MAAGAAALVLQSNPSLTPAELTNALQQTADNAASPNNEVGYGLIDVLAAVQFAASTPTVVAESPVRDSTVASLPSIEVTFSQSVMNVTADDLTVNGSPATALSGSGAGPYTFTGYDPPILSEIEVQLASGGIQDTQGNPFYGDTWSYSLQDACCQSLVGTLPYSESFESDLGQWADDTADDFDWSRHSGATTSSGTGPGSALNGGYYLYTEASDPNSPSKTAILMSPCFDLHGVGGASLEFWYHMYGTYMGSLTLEAAVLNGSSCGAWTTLWAMNGNQGDAWHLQTVSLADYRDQVVKLRFVGVTGSSWSSDMAIDYISMESCGPTVEADFDGDCRVDSTDYAHMSACFTAPGIVQTDPACADADLNDDGPVDQRDFAYFQACYTGNAGTIDLNCMP